MEPNCVSYNMEDISGSPSIAKCELNNSTHNEHPDDFKHLSNYNYRGSEVSVGYKKNKKAKSVCPEQQISKIGPIFFFLPGAHFHISLSQIRQTNHKFLLIVSYCLTFVDYTCKCGLQRRLPKDVCQLL